MSEELRECPHCGATRGLYTLDEYGGLCVDDDLIAQIFCDNCKSAFENENANNGKELIEAWNTRVERTCSIEDVTSGYTETNWGRCSSCGDKFPYQGDVVACPCCGARVVQL